MKEIKVPVVICKLNKKSQRGFYFKRATVEKYLNSPSYSDRMSRRTALGMITHLRRKVADPELMKTIPKMDFQLATKSVVSYLESSYIDGDFWMADLVILDPDKFEGKVKEDILFIRGLVESGVKLTSSAGIDAYYNPVTNEGEVIYDIVGIDFTLSPDFKEGGIR